MVLVRAINKIVKRKKRGGFYNGTDILTSKERESLLLASLIVTIPFFVSAILIILH